MHRVVLVDALDEVCDVTLAQLTGAQHRTRLTLQHVELSGGGGEGGKEGGGRRRREQGREGRREEGKEGGREGGKGVRGGVLCRVQGR